MFQFGSKNKDKELIDWLYKIRFLTVSQLAALTGRSRQVIRRRIRLLNENNAILICESPYGQKRGRPEEILTLPADSRQTINNNGNQIEAEFPNSDPLSDSAIIEHDLLVNWVLIHLVFIENNSSLISVSFYNTKSPSLYSNAENSNRFLNDPFHELLKIDKFSSIPDAVIVISNKDQQKSLLFFLEVDMGTETMASPKRTHKDVRQKILNYQELFRSENYKIFQKIFQSKFNGFRLLFVTNSIARLHALCKLTSQMLPSGFIWLTDQESMFSKGLSSKIWFRGGNIKSKPQSILGERLACEITALDKIR